MPSQPAHRASVLCHAATSNLALKLRPSHAAISSRCSCACSAGLHRICSRKSGVSLASQSVQTAVPLAAAPVPGNSSHEGPRHQESPVIPGTRSCHAACALHIKNRVVVCDCVDMNVVIKCVHC
ncbi:hypothetical protein IG631_19306 [Alternaria alternata]|nr:hypothetical protein IG631_19306 [Alternaria alternata]